MSAKNLLNETLEKLPLEVISMIDLYNIPHPCSIEIKEVKRKCTYNLIKTERGAIALQIKPAEDIVNSYICEFSHDVKRARVCSDIMDREYDRCNLCGEWHHFLDRCKLIVLDDVSK